MALISFVQALADWARAAPDRPAITDDTRTVTRGELERRTNRLARAYAERGVTYDRFVTIGLPNGAEFLEAVVAAWKLGATPQPISWRLPPAERDAIVDLAAPPWSWGAPRRWWPGAPRERLAPYKLPRSYERSEEPLRDEAGKVRRAALRTARVTPPR